MSQTPEIYRGPTVYEAARIEIDRCDRQIEELQDRRRAAVRRLQDPKWQHWEEAERIATKAEPFQATQLQEPRS